jgi:hypothetical protein
LTPIIRLSKIGFLISLKCIRMVNVGFAIHP